jgi:hypothetical protein
VLNEHETLRYPRGSVLRTAYLFKVGTYFRQVLLAELPERHRPVGHSGRWQPGVQTRVAEAEANAS